MKRWCTTLVLILSLSLAALADDSPAAKPALKAGDATPMIPVVAVNGPHKGKKACYTCAYQGAPAVYAFISSTDAVPLLVEIDRAVHKQGEKGLKAAFVATVGAEWAHMLEQFAAQEQIHAPLAYLADGEQDPVLKPWKLPEQNRLTVVVARGKKVVETFTNPKKEDLPKLEAAVAKALADTGADAHPADCACQACAAKTGDGHADGCACGACAEHTAARHDDCACETCQTI